MSRVLRIVLVLLVLFVVVIAAVAIALNSWIGTADFRTRVDAQLSKAAGVPVELGGLSVTVWPVPAVAVDQVRVQSRPAITLERIEARPTWAGLLHGRLEVKTLVVRNAVIPQAALGALAAGFDKSHPKPPGQAASAAPMQEQLALVPRNIDLDGVTWVHASGERSVIDAQAHMDDDNLPGDVHVRVRQGKFAGTDAQLQREETRWKLEAHLAGGTFAGVFTPNRTARQPRIDGDLQTSNVEVSALTAPSRTLTGKLDARTTLQAPLQNLPDGLRTQTQFTIRGAVVHGIDLAKAVRTVGLSRGGDTHLDTLAGTLLTQGKALQLNNLVASSGVLAADGSVAMAADKRLSGHVTVSLTGAATSGALGVPLAVGGTLDQPSVTLSRGALLGAAVGTALAPGLGTAPGANLGDRVGQTLKGLFGK